MKSRVAKTPPPDQRVTVGHNIEHHEVSLIFGDPLAPVPVFVAFTSEQARAIAKQMLRAADEADGKKAH